MTDAKRKLFYWLIKVLSVIISCALPLWAICEKFPVWNENNGPVYSIGVGGILMLVVVVIIFRKSVFNFIRDKFKITHAPPLAIWLGLIAASYVMVFIGRFMSDLIVICWMGFIGCAAGTALTYVAENVFANKENRDG